MKLRRRATAPFSRPFLAFSLPEALLSHPAKQWPLLQHFCIGRQQRCNGLKDSERRTPVACGRSLSQLWFSLSLFVAAAALSAFPPFHNTRVHLSDENRQVYGAAISAAFAAALTLLHCG